MSNLPVFKCKNYYIRNFFVGFFSIKKKRKCIIAAAGVVVECALHKKIISQKLGSYDTQ
jgi:hypothetical protein